MGLKERKKMQFRHRLKRRKKRRKLAAKGHDPDKFYHGRVYVGCKEH